MDIILRDRTRGNVDIEAKVGQDTIFTKDEEKDFVNHTWQALVMGRGRRIFAHGMLLLTI